MTRDEQIVLLVEFVEWCLHNYHDGAGGYYGSREHIDAFLASREPPQPQVTEHELYWSVKQNYAGQWFCYSINESEGRAISGCRLAPFRSTRSKAEADGRASGLPEWRGGK